MEPDDFYLAGFILDGSRGHRNFFEVSFFNFGFDDAGGNDSFFADS